MNTASTADTIDLGKEEYSEQQTKHEGCARKGRRKWSGVELVTMIGGFVLFWPAGLLALGVKLVQGEMWPGSRDNAMPWTAWKKWREEKGSKPFNFTHKAWSQGHWNHSYASSGNAAFDAYKKQQLERLEAERRKLEEEQKAFAEHLARLREAKDKEEFDRFMAERNAAKPE
jgi:hypothetical protein